MFRKFIRAAFAVAMTVVMLACMFGCNATVSNPVIARIGDIDVPYSDFYYKYQNLYQWYEYGYYQFTEDQDVSEEIRKLTFDAVIEEYAPIAAAHAENMALSAEDEETAAANTQALLDNYLSNYASMIDLTLTDADAIYNAKLELLKKDLKSSGIKFDDFIDELETSTRDELLRAAMIEKVRGAAEVTDEEIQDWYDTTLETQHEYFDEDPASYYTYYSSYQSYGGVEPIFAPEGYYYVKQILIKNAAEGEDKDVDALIAEIQQKIDAGEDFDALVAEYNEDTGMAEEGYPFHESIADKYFEEFSAAAKLLKTEGEISDAVTSSSGVHILMRGADISTTPKTVDELHDQIYDYLMLEEGDILEDEAIVNWKEELDIKLYDSRVRYIEFNGTQQ